MTVKRGGLGRNLSMLLSQTEKKLAAEIPSEQNISLSVDKLQPGKFQPRNEMDETSLHELAESIKKQGLLQPLVVREVATEQYEIIAGERRWRASQLAGLTAVPVIVRQVDDETAMAMALVENLQREDLNAMDQARAMHRLTTEFGLTHQQVAELLSKSRAAVSNYLRLLNLNAMVRRMLENGDLDMGHARALLMLKETEQAQVAELIVAKSLSVRETEALVARIQGGVPVKQMKNLPDITPQFKDRVQMLARQLQTQVKLKPGRSGQGTIVIHYDTVDTLTRMMDLLTAVDA